MFLSKIFKDEGSANAEPFILESHGIIIEGLPEENEAKVGTSIEAIERDAYERGFKAGERAGFDFGKQKAEALFSGLSKVLEELSNFKDSLHKPCEKEVLELCLAISKKVVQRELELKEDSVLASVRAGLKAIAGAGEISIKVNSKDLEVLHSNKGDLVKFGNGVKGVILESDDAVSKGGCVITTNYGEVDATIETLMAEIDERLRNAL